MKKSYLKKIGVMLLAIIVSITTNIFVGAISFDINNNNTQSETGISVGATSSYKAMYDYNYSSISGVKLTNAVYNYDTYAFTIARADTCGTPSVTTFQLLARIYCAYSSGTNPTTYSDDSANGIYRCLGSSGIYLNSGSATYRTPVSGLQSLRAYNFFNNVSFDSEFYKGSDFTID